jgi:hypothetical protein
VAIAGCYHEYDGRQFPFDATGYGTGDARLVFVAGEDDEVCPSWQSEDAAETPSNWGSTRRYPRSSCSKNVSLVGARGLAPR